MGRPDPPVGEAAVPEYEPVGQAPRGEHEPRRWWRRDALDVLGLLREQAAVTRAAMAAFAAWSATGDPGEAERVRRLEHDADRARHRLWDGLTDVLSSPLDQEDVFVLSERLDQIVNAAKNVTRLATALGWVPDTYAAEMGAALGDATGLVDSALQRLHARGRARSEVLQDADAAVKAAHRVEKVYRQAMAALAGDAAAPGRLVTVEMYRRYEDLQRAVEMVVHRVWFAVLKEQ